jgi:hypothetical protein
MLVVKIPFGGYVFVAENKMRTHGKPQTIMADHGKAHDHAAELRK